MKTPTHVDSKQVFVAGNIIESSIKILLAVLDVRLLISWYIVLTHRDPERRSQ